MRHKKHQLFWVILVASLAPHAVYAAEAEKLSCIVADDLAGKSYTRAAEAKNSNNLVAAYQHKLAFWDIFKHGSHCVKVKTMAMQLSVKKLGDEDNAPSTQEAFMSFAGPSGLNLPQSCFNGGTFSCRLIITEPPKGNSKGWEGGPDFYLLDEDSLSTKRRTSPSWKKFVGPKLEFPLLEKSEK